MRITKTKTTRENRIGWFTQRGEKKYLYMGNFTNKKTALKWLDNYLKKGKNLKRNLFLEEYEVVKVEQKITPYLNKNKKITKCQFAKLKNIPNELVYVTCISHKKVHFFYFEKENGIVISKKSSFLPEERIKEFKVLNKSFRPDKGILKMIKKDLKEECLFENYEKQSPELAKIVNKWTDKMINKGLTYKNCGEFLKEVQKIGYTFQYDLVAEPFNLKKM